MAEPGEKKLKFSFKPEVSVSDLIVIGGIIAMFVRLESRVSVVEKNDSDKTVVINKLTDNQNDLAIKLARISEQINLIKWSKPREGN